MENIDVSVNAGANGNDGRRPADRGRISTVVLQVQGMTCGSCERHVGEALATVSGVSEVRVSRTSSSATVKWATSVPDVNALVDAVLAAGYDASIASVAGEAELPAGPKAAAGCRCCEVRA